MSEEEIKKKDYIPQEHPYKEFFATVVAIFFIICINLFILGWLIGFFWLATKYGGG